MEENKDFKEELEEKVEENKEIGRQNISINLKKDEILIKILAEASHDDIIAEINNKLPKLKNLYQGEKTPIYITGKNLENEEMDEIQDMINKELEVDVKFDSPKELGLSGIKTTFERDLNVSETKLYRGSLRCGTRLEFEKSIVIIGDVNAGAEVIAGGNIIVTGFLKGLAHAGAKGNKKAIIAARGIENPQIRIANIVKELNNLPEISQNKDRKQDYAYVKDNEIVIE